MPIPAPDKDETALGHHRSPASAATQPVREVDAAQQRVVAQDLTAFPKRHTPRDLTFVQVDRREKGVRRLDQRDRAEAASGRRPSSDDAATGTPWRSCATSRRA